MNNRFSSFISNYPPDTMIICNPHPIFELRGIKKPLAFMVNLGFTYNIAWRIFNNKVTRFDLAHLDTLCVHLKCTPNDILQWNPPADTAADHPLQALRPKTNQQTIAQMLSDFPVVKVAELEKAIQELKQKE